VLLDVPPGYITHVNTFNVVLTSCTPSCLGRPSCSMQVLCRGGCALLTRRTRLVIATETHSDDGPNCCRWA
jgi:hypothetical protein